jgi:hypothetical protein
MNHRTVFALVALLFVGAGLWAAKDPAEPSEKTPWFSKEHEWLGQLAGEWTLVSEAIVDPSQPPVKSDGKENVRALGGAWLVSEGSGTMPGGGPMSWILSLGYDPEKKKYVGTWIGSMMSQLWVYEGSLDATGKILTLDTEGPNMAEPGKRAKYRDVIEIKGKDERVLRSSMQGEDGKWQTFVTAEYRRKKP